MASLGWKGLITVEFLLFTKLEFTTNVQNVLHNNQYTHTYIHFSSCTVAQKGLEAVANTLTGTKKWVAEAFLYFELELSPFGGF
jgi:hypothetical protein